MKRFFALSTCVFFAAFSSGLTVQVDNQSNCDMNIFVEAENTLNDCDPVGADSDDFTAMSCCATLTPTGNHISYISVLADGATTSVDIFPCNEENYGVGMEYCISGKDYDVTYDRFTSPPTITITELP